KRRKRSAPRSSTRPNSCAAHAPNPKLASQMTAPLATPFSPATDGLTVGRGALRQLHASLLRDAADHAIAILQEAGSAAGQGLFQAFCAWLPGQLGVARPAQADAAQLNAWL